MALPPFFVEPSILGDGMLLLAMLLLVDFLVGAGGCVEVELGGTTVVCSVLAEFVEKQGGLAVCWLCVRFLDGRGTPSLVEVTVGNCSFSCERDGGKEN